MKESFRNRLKDMNILVVGMGRSGKAALRALSGTGAVLYAQDSQDASNIDEDFLQFLEEGHVKTYFGSLPDDMSVFDMLVLSPGVPPQLDFVQEAAAAGAEIIGELELAYRMTDAHFAAITGTNGKTTVSNLLVDLLEAYRTGVL